jgi:hypothetical protein
MLLSFCTPVGPNTALQPMLSCHSVNLYNKAIWNCPASSLPSLTAQVPAVGEELTATPTSQTLLGFCIIMCGNSLLPWHLSPHQTCYLAWLNGHSPPHCPGATFPGHILLRHAIPQHPMLALVLPLGWYPTNQCRGAVSSQSIPSTEPRIWWDMLVHSANTCGLHAAVMILLVGSLASTLSWVMTRWPSRMFTLTSQQGELYIDWSPD